MAAAHLSPKIPDKPWVDTSPPAYVIPPEPWFYRWLEGIAGLLWYGAMVIVALNGVLVAGLIVLVIYAWGNTAPGVWPTIAGIFFAPVLALLPVAVASAMIRLAVDVARNVRDMRFSAG